MKRRPRSPLSARASLVVALSAIAACALGSTACESTATSTDLQPVPTGAQPSCRRSGQRYLAFLASGACADVASPRSKGTWSAHALFPAAPPGIRDSACAYEWTVPPAAPAAAPDIDVLDALDAEHLARDLETRTTAACEATMLPPSAAAIVSSATDGGDAAPTGVSGCDVCARLVARTLFVILPADKLDLRTVIALTEGGKYVPIRVDVPKGTQAFSVALPSLREDSYKEGRVPLFRAPL